MHCMTPTPSRTAPLQATGLLLGGSALLRACGRTHFGARKLIQGVGGAIVESESGADGESARPGRRSDADSGSMERGGSGVPISQVYVPSAFLSGSQCRRFPGAELRSAYRYRYDADLIDAGAPAGRTYLPATHAPLLPCLSSQLLTPPSSCPLQQRRPKAPGSPSCPYARCPSGCGEAALGLLRPPSLGRPHCTLPHLSALAWAPRYW